MHNGKNAKEAKAMKEFAVKIGRLLIHNKEQIDLGKKPLICLHWYFDNGNECKRLFCI